MNKKQINPTYVYTALVVICIQLAVIATQLDGIIKEVCK